VEIQAFTGSTMTFFSSTVAASTSTFVSPFFGVADVLRGVAASETDDFWRSFLSASFFGVTAAGFTTDSLSVFVR